MALLRGLYSPAEPITYAGKTIWAETELQDSLVSSQIQHPLLLGVQRHSCKSNLTQRLFLCGVMV